MFKQKKGKINPNTTDTLIGEGSVFEGNVKSEGSIRIEGKVTGPIECTGDLIIGELGSVHSNVIARNIIIAGEVHGNVVTEGILTISQTGQLHGDASAKTFIIDEGGVFYGTSRKDAIEMTVPDQAEDKDKDKEMDTDKEMQPLRPLDNNQYHNPIAL